MCKLSTTELHTAKRKQKAMAKEVSVRLLDDMETEKVVAAETVEFALDGVAYEIDLSAKNAAKLRAGQQPFIDHARRVGRATPGGSRKGGVQVAKRDDLDDIRAWARAQGKTVSDRGRIAQSIQDEYDARDTPTTAATTDAKPTRKPTAKKESEDAQQPAFSAT